MPADIPWVKAVWTVPTVETPPTRVPMMIQETPVLDNDRSATEKSSEVFTRTDCLIAIMLIQAKVSRKVI